MIKFVPLYLKTVSHQNNISSRVKISFFQSSELYTTGRLCLFVIKSWYVTFQEGNVSRLNSFHVMAVILRPCFGVVFLKGHISLKNWTQRVLLRHDTTSFKRTCFLITLKVLLDGLYVFNGQPNIPVPTYLLKRTVEIWMHTKSARATLIFVDI
jgi:hypothetical protein